MSNPALLLPNSPDMRGADETEGKQNPMNTRFSPAGGHSNPVFLLGSDNTVVRITEDTRKKIVVEMRPPYLYCDTCHRRKTYWRVKTDDGDWKRICPHCQDEVERRLVESIVALNSRKVRVGVER